MSPQPANTEAAHLTRFSVLRDGVWKQAQLVTKESPTVGVFRPSDGSSQFRAPLNSDNVRFVGDEPS